MGDIRLRAGICIRRIEWRIRLIPLSGPAAWFIRYGPAELAELLTQRPSQWDSTIRSGWAERC